MADLDHPKLFVMNLHTRAVLASINVMLIKEDEMKARNEAKTGI